MLARRPAVAISMRVTGPCGERHREAAEPLGHRQERLEHAPLVLGHERQVERVRDGQPAERRHDLLGDHDAGAILRLARRARQVRREQEVGRVAQRRVGRQRLLREDVQRGARELARAQRRDERLLVDERAARGVDEQRAGPQQRQARRVDQAARRRRDRQVEADDVGHRERRLDRLGLLGAELGDALRGHERVVGDGAHAERARPRGHEPADAAEAEQRERLVGELDAREALALPGAVAQRALGGADVARQREQQRERVLGRRDDVRLGGVADDDARGRRGVHVDVVDADARAADHAQLGRARDQRGVDGRGRAHDERIRVGQRRGADRRPARARRRRRPRAAARGPASAIGSATTQRGLLIAAARPAARRGRR